MNWQQLISNKRLGQEHRHAERHDDRSEFKRDYDRLIYSAPFRRLQNKTQVFPLPGSVFVHNRLTHSLEVSSLGQSLGNDVCTRLKQKHPELANTLFEEIDTIVSAACLAHDMGNPPFGHSGEKAIQTFFRLLTHRFFGRRQGGFVMTYSMLASIVKYPFSSSLAGRHGKFGFFQTEAEDYRKIADELGLICKSKPGEPLKYARHPLVYLVEAADDICYEIMDIEDAHKLKILSFEETTRLLLGFFDEDMRREITERIREEGVTDNNEQIVYMRASVIGKLENECVRTFVEHEEEILNGTFNGSIIDHIAPLQREAYRRCTEISYQKIYHSKPVLDIERSGYKSMETRMSVFVEAAVNPKRFYSQQLIRRVSSQYDIHSDDVETRIMAVIDYISGMTDVYALDIYQKIKGVALPIV